MQPLSGAIIAPFAEVEIDALPLGIVLGQHAPLRSSDDNIQDGVDDLAHVQAAWSSTWLGSGEQMLDTMPLTVGQVSWVDLVLHILSVPACLTERHPFSNGL